MIQVPVYNAQGQEVETISFDEAVFGGRVNRKLLRQAVLMYEANRRSGTAKTKERGEVAGSGRKPWRQKGTGRARSGDRRSPVWRGGGTIFGPRPRDYSYSIPKKARKQATRYALLSKFIDGEVKVVTNLGLEGPKTRQVAGILKVLGIDGSCLIAVPAEDQNLVLSARNLPRVDVRPIRELNAYELLLRKRLLLTKDALEALLSGGQGAEGGEQ